MTTRSSTTRTVFVIIGSLAALTGIGFGIGGGALLWAHNTQRDSAGFYSTSAERLETSSYALTSEQVDLGVDEANGRWVPGGVSAVRLQATAGPERPVFMGIARSADIDRYLAGSAHSEVVDFDVDPFRAEMRQSQGTTRPAPPVDQNFWAASASGTGAQTVTWPAQSGEWAVVVMNSDASPGVSVDVAVGAKTGVLMPIGVGMTAFALLLFAGGWVFILLGVIGSRSRSDAYPPPLPPMPVPEPASVS